MWTLLLILCLTVELVVTAIATVVIFGLCNKNGVDINTRFLSIKITHKEEVHHEHKDQN